MRSIKVDNCKECPFVNTDNEYSRRNTCKAKYIELKGWQQLPEDKVHEDCPLKEENIIVKLNY